MPQQHSTNLFARILRILRHRWRDARDAHRAVPPAMVQRLTRRVAASEARHSGEVRICVESALPTGYLWQSLRARDRAITLFGKLRVWDTEHNNGVLIYLLLAERSIEIVADRGLNAHVSEAAWQAMAQRIGTAFKDCRYEDGLTLALTEVTALLRLHFPLGASEKHRNELPDEPILQ